MEGLLLILFLIVAIPLIFIIIGIVKLVSPDAEKRKTGKAFLLGGIICAGIELLIGFSICSGISFNGH